MVWNSKYRTFYPAILCSRYDISHYYYKSLNYGCIHVYEHRGPRVKRVGRYKRGNQKP